MERREAVIGDDEQSGVWRGSHDPPDLRVHALVGFQEQVFVLAPQHVRVLVDAQEMDKENAALKAAQSVFQQAKLLVANAAALLQVFLASQRA